MRKLMVVVAMLALMLAASAPALAQDFEQENEFGTVSAEVNYAIGTQVIQAVNQQNQFVNQNVTANAAGGAGGDVIDTDGDGVGDVTFGDRTFQGGGPGDRIIDIDGDGVPDTATGGAGGAGGEVDVTQVAAQLGISVEAVNAVVIW